ncbi:MAG: ABC transporter permease subunit [Proteobacteria bacterium]|nr:ABC transporter permease subunit [Pseudomonadota bacterium]
MFTIYKRDLARMIHSNVVGVIIILFLMMMGAMFFIDFFDTIQPLNLRKFFSQAPLLLSIFCPALTMAIISDERSHQTLDLLETMPVTTWKIVLAKFLVCMTLLSVVFIFTLSYPITLSTLGPLDWGPVIGGYIALLLLGGGYVALGIFASACSKDQVTSFLFAFFLCFALTFIHRLSADSSGMTATILQNFSVNAHFSNIARGVIDIRDIIYAVSLQFLALTATHLVLDIKKYPKVVKSIETETKSED